MPTYYFTFGQKYRHEKHPSGRPAHPDGYIAVFAEDEPAARRRMHATYGRYWAFCYENKPDSSMYPKGEIGSV